VFLDSPVVLLHVSEGNAGKPGSSER